jgi:hypothetical protein
LNVNSSTTDYNVKIYVGAELLVNKSFGF